MLDLQRRQLDKQFDQVRPVIGIERPSKGWIKSIREALGMTLLQLGNRMGVRPQVVQKIEGSEAASSISLKTLQKAAAALNLRVFYILVPEKSLEETVEAQIRKKAKEIIGAIDHSMSLEQQKISAQESKAQMLRIIEDIKKRKNISMIWDENES